MAGCKLTNITDPLLQSYVDYYGQEKGTRLFMSELIQTIEELQPEKRLYSSQEFNNMNNVIDKYNEENNSSHRYKGVKVGNQYRVELETKFNEGTLFKEATEEDYLIGSESEDIILPEYVRLKNRLQSEITQNEKRLTKLYSNRRVLKRKYEKTPSESLQDKIHAVEANIDEIKKVIDNVNDQISELTKQQSAEILERVANEQLDYVDKMLSKPSVTYEELYGVNQIIDIWLDAQDTMFGKDTDIDENVIEVLEQAQLKAHRALKQYKNVTDAKIIEDSNKEGTGTLKQENLDYIEEVGAAKAFTLDLSRLGSPLVSKLDTWIKNAAFKRTSEVKELVSNIKEAFKKVKDLGVDLDVFFQLDTDGVKTGNLVDRYSSKFYENIKTVNAKYKAELNKARDAANVQSANKIRMAALRRKLVWEKDNLVTIDFRKLDDAKYIESLRSEYGDYTTELVDRAKEKYEYFKEKRKLFEESLALELKDGILTATEYNSELEKWDNNNNIEEYLDYISKPIARFKSYSNVNMFLVKVPKKDKGYFDEQFSQIEANPELLELYNFITELMKDLIAYLPNHRLQRNFLPKVKKDLAETASNFNLKGAFQYMEQSFINSITSDAGLQNLYMTEEQKTIPVRFINDNLSEEERSADLEGMLAAFTTMAINYKHMSQVEDKVLVVNKIIKDATARAVSPDGSFVRKGKAYLNDYVESKMGKPTLNAAVDYAIDAMLYGETRAAEGITKAKKFTGDVITFSSTPEGIEAKAAYDKARKRLSEQNAIKEISKEYPDVTNVISKKERYAQLEKERDKLEEAREKGTITEEELVEQVNKLDEEAKDLGKNLNWSKAIDQVVKFTYLKAFAYNPFSAINNVAFGVIGNIVHAAGKRDFTTKQMIEAFGMVFRSTKHSLKFDNFENNKIYNIMEKLNIVTEVTDLDSNEDSKLSKVKKYGPFMLLRKGDYMIKAQTTVAMMLNTTIKDKQGNDRPLWEAFDTKGNWNIEEFGENTDWAGDFDNVEHNKEFLKFRNKAMQVNKLIHGNFDTDSKQMMKKYTIGRLLAMFRGSWIPEGVNTRFGGREYDELLGREVEGRYRTAFDLGFKNSFKIIYKLMLLKGDKAFNGLDIKPKDLELIKENMRRNLTEMYFLTSMFALYYLLKFSIDDDDDEFSAANKRMALNMLYRIQADITFYLSPGTFDEIVSNPIPVMKTFKNFSQSVNAISKYMQDDDYYDSETTLRSITNSFPYLNLYNKVSFSREKLR